MFNIIIPLCLHNMKETTLYRFWDCSSTINVRTFSYCQSLYWFTYNHIQQRVKMRIHVADNPLNTDSAAHWRHVISCHVSNWTWVFFISLSLLYGTFSFTFSSHDTSPPSPLCLCSFSLDVFLCGSPMEEGWIIDEWHGRIGAPF